MEHSKEHIDSVKQLIADYRTVSRDSVKAASKWNEANGYAPIPDFINVAKTLTGYGSITTCKLCATARVDAANANSANMCEFCIHGVNVQSVCLGSGCPDDESYYQIGRSTSIDGFIVNCNARADYLENLLKEKGYEL